MLSVAPLPEVPAGWKLALALAFRDKGHKSLASSRGNLRPMSMSNLPPILEEPEPTEFEDSEAIETFVVLQDICNTRISISVARPAIQTRSSSYKQTTPTVEFDSLSLVTTSLLIAPTVQDSEPQPYPMHPRDHSTHRPPARDLRDPAALTSPPPSRTREVSPVQNIRRAGGKRRKDPDTEDPEHGIGAASKRRRTTPPMAAVGAHPDTSRNIVTTVEAGNRITPNRRRRRADADLRANPVRQQGLGTPLTPSPASGASATTSETRTPPGSRGSTGKRKRSFPQVARDCDDDDPGAAEDEDASRYAKTRRAPFW